MTEQSTTVYRSQTGYAPTSQIRFEQAARVVPHHHQESDIVLYRMSGAKGAAGMSEATRGGDAPDLLYLSRGTGIGAVGKVAGTPFAIKPHRDLRTTFTPSGADASVTFAASASSSNLMFPKGYLQSLLEDRICQSFRPILYGPDKNLIQLFYMLEAEIVQPGFVTRAMVEGLSHAIAARLIGIDPSEINLEADKIHLPKWKLRRVIDFIEANLTQEIALADLAAEAGLSMFHFARVFKQAVGVTPYHFVRDRRIDRARALLLDESLDLCHVAAACGFANQSHFTAAFSKAAGISPGRYRRHRRA